MDQVEAKLLGDLPSLLVAVRLPRLGRFVREGVLAVRRHADTYFDTVDHALAAKGMSVASWDLISARIPWDRRSN